MAGILVESELSSLNRLLNQKIDCLVLGGAKVSDKLDLLVNLMPKVDSILIGGGMSYTFLKYKGVPIGSSIFDDKIDVKVVFESAEKARTKIYLPIDHVVTVDGREALIVNSISDGFAGWDIGPETSALYTDVLLKSKSVFWNGPMGIFEKGERFSKGSLAILMAMANVKERGGLSIVGI